MPRSEKGDFQKHTLHLFSGDYARLQDAYPDVGAAAIIRKLVHTHLDKINPPVNLNKVKTGDLNV